MAANVVVLKAEEVEVVKNVLARLGEGGIIVFPKAAKDFKKEFGKAIPDGETVEYDWDGDPEVWVDVVRTTDDRAVAAINDHLSGDDDEDEEDEKPAKKTGKGKKPAADEDDEEDEKPAPKKGGKKPAKKDEDDEEEEEEDEDEEEEEEDEDEDEDD